MCNFNSDLQVLYLKNKIIIIILYFLTLIEKVVKIIFKSMARSIGIGMGHNFNASVTNALEGRRLSNERMGATNFWG